MGAAWPDWISPRTGVPLVWENRGEKTGETEMEPAALVSIDGRERFPVEGGIPRFVEQEEFTASFGYQWNRFDVRQAREDEETWEIKTGVRLSEVNGLRVLDAGCGGGRYCRVLAERGALVVGVDRSIAVNKARELTADFDNACYAQADLTTLPLRRASFDLVFSIGVLHHGPDPRSAFRVIADMVRPGGRLSVWLYRRNSWPQEKLNDALRFVARCLPRPVLVTACQGGAILGAIPGINRVLNKVVNFSNHPRWENRVCDNFDWYAATYQAHYDPREVTRWFQESGFVEIRELLPAKSGKLYCSAWRNGLIIGSGVNITGLRSHRSHRASRAGREE